MGRSASRPGPATPGIDDDRMRTRRSLSYSSSASEEDCGAKGDVEAWRAAAFHAAGPTWSSKVMPSNFAFAFTFAFAFRRSSSLSDFDLAEMCARRGPFCGKAATCIARTLLCCILARRRAQRRSFSASLPVAFAAETSFGDESDADECPGDGMGDITGEGADEASIDPEPWLRRRFAMETGAGDFFFEVALPRNVCSIERRRLNC